MRVRVPEGKLEAQGERKECGGRLAPRELLERCLILNERNENGGKRERRTGGTRGPAR